MMQISTNLYRCIHKYPASSENVHVEKKKKKKNQRPFKKGNRNIISIFSFRCLNWHEEYNQISLLTVTHMLLQEREKYHLPAYISCQDGFLLLLLFLFPFFWQVRVHYGAIIQVVKNLTDQQLLYLQSATSVEHRVEPQRFNSRSTFFHQLNPCRPSQTPATIELHVTPMLPPISRSPWYWSIWAL